MWWDSSASKNCIEDCALLSWNLYSQESEPALLLVSEYHSTPSCTPAEALSPSNIFLFEVPRWVPGRLESALFLRFSAEDSQHSRIADTSNDLAILASLFEVSVADPVILVGSSLSISWRCNPNPQLQGIVNLEAVAVPASNSSSSFVIPSFSVLFNCPSFDGVQTGSWFVHDLLLYIFQRGLSWLKQSSP